MLEIKKMAKIIEQNGGKIYLVGGALRDKLLKVENHDEDYCITGISSSTFLKLFPQAHIRGKSFEVYDIDGIEFAMARTEKKVENGHKGFEIETKEITIQQDLLRRDITINSMAQDVLTGEIIDIVGGKQDLNNKIIKATSNAFSEDPLRVYRAARFAALLDFNIDESTLKQMKLLKEELRTLSKERVFCEFKKALKTVKPSKFFDALRKAEVLDVHFKEIYDLIGAEQPKEFHPEGDAYNHTMIALNKCVELTNNLEIRFSVLVHDLGKGKTPKELYPHHYGHDLKGVPVVREFCTRIGIPKTWIKCGLTSAKWHMKGGIFNNMTPKKQLEFIEKVNSSMLGLDGMKIVVECDKNRDNLKYEEVDFDKIGKECLDSINGNYIMEKYNLYESIQFGEKLHQERIAWLKNNRIKGENNERESR